MAEKQKNREKEDKRKMDEVLRKMLNTPPKPDKKKKKGKNK